MFPFPVRHRCATVVLVCTQHGMLPNNEYYIFYHYFDQLLYIYHVCLEEVLTCRRSRVTVTQW